MNSDQYTVLTNTFKKGSRTYFSSSLFLPKRIRLDVFRLYGFVRIVDNFVDSKPQDSEEFYSFIKKYEMAITYRNSSGNIFIDEFVSLSREKRFDPEWTKAFLHSMELDLVKKFYPSLEETLEYIHGSAEVIGYFMARLLNLKEDSYPYAGMLGRSMQYINFIRDIAEDNQLGRIYLPLLDSGLSDLRKETAINYPDLFRSFIRAEIKRYLEWQKKAEKGFVFIPYRPLIAIKTASEMYFWTAKKIDHNPFIVYQKKVKPSKTRILLCLLKNAIILPFKRG